jgi:hypothetical protein
VVGVARVTQAVVEVSGVPEARVALLGVRETDVSVAGVEPAEIPITRVEKADVVVARVPETDVPGTGVQPADVPPEPHAEPRRFATRRWRSMLVPTRWRFRRPVAAVVAVVALVLAVAVVMADRWSNERSMSIQGNVASAITTANLTAVAHTRVFFGHQSVGMNVLDAVPGVYADHGVSGAAERVDPP